jgi:hypothetical protein
MFADCTVADVNTVSEFIRKYYKNDRIRGDFDGKVANAKSHIVKYGYALISRHESVTGNPVAFYPNDFSSLNHAQ